MIGEDPDTPKILWNSKCDIVLSSSGVEWTLEYQRTNILASQYFLKTAQALSSIGDKKGCMDAVLAAHYEAAVIEHSWALNDSFLSCRAASESAAIFSWSADGKIYVIDPEKPYSKTEFNATSAILGTTCNSNCSRAISWDVDRNVKIWSLVDTSPPIVLRQDSAVNGASFNPSEDRVLIWGANGAATLWQLSNRKVIRIFRHFDATNAHAGRLNLAASVGHLEAQIQKGGEVCSASLSQNEALVITAGSDASAHLWSISNDVPIFTYNGSGALRGTKFTSHGDYAICWGDREIAWFQTDPAKGPNSLLRTVAASFVQGVELDEAEQRLLTWTRGGDFAVYEFPSGLPLRSFEQSGTINGARMSPDGKSILCWDNTGVVTQWDPLESPRPRKFVHGKAVYAHVSCSAPGQKITA